MIEISLIEFIWSLLLGIGFGIALQKAQLTKYSKIVNIFRFKDFTVLKFMLTAIITSMPLIFLLRDIGVIEFLVINPTYVLGNFIGGCIFGIGMASAGFCSGTIAGGIGQGSLDYLIPGTLGFLTGSYIFGATYSSIFTKIFKVTNLGPVTIPELLHVNHWVVIIPFILMVLLLFYFLEKKKIRLNN